MTQPDYIISLSGGIDSTAAAVVAKDAIETHQAGGNFQKKPVAIYCDTRVGNPLNRIYVEELADWLGVQLWTLRTDEKFEEQVSEEDAPGAAQHPTTRNKLKLRQTSKLITLADNPHIIMGISADESENRANRQKVMEKDRHVEVYPVHRVPRKKRVEIVLRSDCPRNPLWEQPRVIADCGCLANGDPSELDETINEYPAFGNRLKAIEEAYGSDKLSGNLGWDGLTAREKSAKRSGVEQQTLPFCSGGCNARQDPAEVHALASRRMGATIEQSVRVLREEPRTRIGCSV